MSESRHARQVALPVVGAEGQQRLSRATVAVVGLGALGSVEAEWLVRAGVGRLLLVDRDVVETTNLQRQVLYTEDDAARGLPKAEAAAARLRAVDSAVELVPLALDLGPDAAEERLAEADLLLDGTDNFETRYLLNDLAVATRRPWVYAGAVGTHGAVAAFPADAGCLRCLWPEPPPPGATPTCRDAGVLGPAVGAVASLAAAQAVRLLVGDAPEAPRLLHLDAWSLELRAVAVPRDPGCPACGARRFPWLDGERGRAEAEPVCGSEAVQLPPDGARPDLAAGARRLAGRVEGLETTGSLLRWRHRGLELYLFADGRVLVRGTRDVGRARSALARTLGC